MSTCVKVYGSSLYVTISSVLTVTPNMVELHDNDESAQAIDCSALSDTAVQTTCGMLDYGTIKGTVNYDPNNSVHQFFHTSLGTSIVCELRYGNSATNKQAFTGYLTKFSGKGGDRGALYRRDFEWKLNTLTNS